MVAAVCASVASLAKLMLIASVAFTASAKAEPGTPGVPQASTTVYVEDAQNRPGPSPIVRLDAYMGATGQTYTANPNWLTACNGWIASANQSTTAADQVADCVSQINWNRAQQLAWALGLHSGQSQAVAQGNYGVSAYTAGDPGAGLVEFQTATNISFPTSNRFVSFSVDVAAINCSVSAPLLQFSLLNDSGTATPAGSQINACSSGTTQSVPTLGDATATTASTGTYTSNGAVLISGASVGVQMVNNNGSGLGNDHAFDNIAILDATPQLDKEFSPTNLFVGGTSTLTLTITNTSELGAKNGWSFTDSLPVGLTVVEPAASTTCPSGVVTAPVDGSTIDVSGNLSAGMSSCTVTVSVTSDTAGTYTNDASNITSSVGINPPGETSVTFGEQPSFGSCDATMYLGQNVPTGLFEFNTSSNPFIVDPVGPASSIQYNAIAMNPVDNFIYGLRVDVTPGVLVRIGSDGSVAELGTITGFPTNSVAGEIGPDGTYYVATGATLYRIDTETRTATSVTLSQTLTGVDLAWHNGLLYMAGTNSGPLYAINPTTGAVTATGSTGIAGGFGGMFGASNGVFGSNNSGGFYQFDLATGRGTLISDLPGSGNNDGAKCVNTAMTFPADVAITKTDSSETYAPGTDVVYTIVVSNSGPFGVQNALVNDPLPAGITTASWTCGSPTNGGVCSVASGTGAIADVPVNLAANSSVTFTLTMSVPADFTGDLVNTTTATNPSDVPDPDPSSNTSTDTDVLASPSMTIEKTGTLNDVDGDEALDLGETISYSFLVTNNGNVTLTNVTVNDPLLTNASVALDQGPQTLAPGGTFTFTATYTPTQQDIDNGSVTNTATATGTDPNGGTPQSPPDSVTVPPDPTPGLNVEKTGTLNDTDGDGLLDLGETISYSFLATNDGAVTLTNVTVNDPLLTNAGVALDQGPQTLAPGATFTFTATYTPTQQDIDNGSVTNTATATGTNPNGGIIESPLDTVTVPPEPASLRVEKTGTFNDVDRDGYASIGDTMTYTLTVTNNGGQTVTDVWPNDAGPTFNGTPASNNLSAFQPSPVTLVPGASQAFTATYVLSQSDIDNAGGIADGVRNSATAQGQANGVGVTSDPSTSLITTPAPVPSDIMVVKQAGLRAIRRGEKAPFTIKVTNHANRDAGAITVTDSLPSGFRYVEGSATVDEVAVTPVVNGLRVTFENVALGPNAEVVVRLQMLALSSAGPGEHTNRANVTDPAGRPLAPQATAMVEILVEPVFDCGDIIGKVFDDVDRNGYQDDGEPGLPGVRIATAKGWLVTTDKYGRFHVPCAALPDARIGSNFIMKLDPRTLPTGYRLTTENPRVVRLTAGKMSKLNFGASIGRVVRLDLKDEAFVADGTELAERWADGIDQLILLLRQEQSVLRLSYIDAGAEEELVEERLKRIDELIQERWRDKKGQYRLEIETRVEVGE
jgi:uncharacterized repeat protein (TIGR01451 family)